MYNYPQSLTLTPSSSLCTSTLNMAFTPPHRQHEPIAIVGIGCRFPGGASSPSKLWELLREPKTVAKQIPPDRFNLERFFHPDGHHHGTCNVQETYFLDEDVRHFDSAFFGIPPGGMNLMSGFLFKPTSTSTRLIVPAQRRPRWTLSIDC